MFNSIQRHGSLCDIASASTPYLQWYLKIGEEKKSGKGIVLHMTVLQTQIQGTVLSTYFTH